MVPRLSLGGLGMLWVAGSRKEPVCWFSRKAQLCELTELLSEALDEASGPQADKGSLWRSSLVKLHSPHPEATGTGIRLSPTPHCTALSFGTVRRCRTVRGAGDHEKTSTVWKKQLSWFGRGSEGVRFNA